MTIAIGFRCIDGVLLCADSQYSGWEKSHGNKIFTELLKGSSVSFAISGDSDYARTAIQDSIEAAALIPKEEQTVSELRKAIRLALREVMDEYSRQGHLDQSQKPEFIVAVNTPTGTGLFSSRETAFSPVENFDCRGTGSYLANYVLRHLQFCNMRPVTYVLPMAIRALAAVKRHDLNCGGGSQFSVIRSSPETQSASSFGTARYSLDIEDNIIDRFESSMSELFSSMGNLSQSEEKFDEAMRLFQERIRQQRKQLATAGSQYADVVKSLSQSAPLNQGVISHQGLSRGD